MGLRAAMPKSLVVDSLSEPESEAPLVPKTAPKKRKRGEPPAIDQKSEETLKLLLSKQCACNKKTCLQQFRPPERFATVLEYRRHFFELEKMDADNFAPRLLFGFRWRGLNIWQEWLTLANFHFGLGHEIGPPQVLHQLLKT